MSKVNYNGDAIKNTLLPTINSALEAIGNATNIANGVYFPNGNSTWSGIKEKIENCRLDTKPYYEWIANSVSSIENIVNNENDNLQQIKVTEIKGRKSIVK